MMKRQLDTIRSEYKWQFAYFPEGDCDQTKLQKKSIETKRKSGYDVMSHENVLVACAAVS